MPNIGPLEIAIVLVVLLIVFGPKRLPSLGRKAGREVRVLRDSVRLDDDHGVTESGVQEHEEDLKPGPEDETRAS